MTGSTGLGPDHPDLARLHARPASRVADIVSRCLDPLLVVLAGLVVVAVRAAPVLPGLAWAALATVFCVVVPEVVLRRRVRAGQALDRDLVVREQRHVPLLLSIASVAAGVVVLVVAGAPRPVTAFVLAILAGIAVMAALTRVVKASFHVGVAAAVLLVCGLDGVPLGVCLGLAPLLLALGWARVRAGRHTLGQVLLGAVTSAVVVGGVFALAA